MWKTFLTVTLLLLAAVVLLSVSILLKKNGRFPDTHVSGNKAMHERGIRCVQSQDMEMRIDNPHAIKERKEREQTKQ